MVLFSSHVSKCLGTYTKPHHLLGGQKSQLKVSPKKVTPQRLQLFPLLVRTEISQAQFLPRNFPAPPYLAQPHTRQMQLTHEGRESPCGEILFASLLVVQDVTNKREEPGLSLPVVSCSFPAWGAVSSKFEKGLWKQQPYRFLGNCQVWYKECPSR